MSKGFTNHSSLTNWELVSINPKEKNWNWNTIFNIWANSIQTVIGFSLIASLYLAYNLNGVVVFLGSVLAGLFAIWISNLIGKPSQKLGIPFAVFLRVSMGIYGAKYASTLRGIIALSMFGIQTFFISKSIGFLIRIFLFKLDKNLFENEIFNQFFLSLGIIDWIALLASSILQLYLFTRAIKLIKTIINFSGIIIYLSLIVFALMVFFKNQNELINAFISIFYIQPNFEFNDWMPIFTIFGTMFAYFSIILINFGDYSRYVSSEKELKKGNWSLLFNIIFFSFLSIVITIGCDLVFKQKMINPERILTNPTDIIGLFDQMTLSIIALVLILIASLSTNLIANFIPSKNILINFIPNKLSVKSSSYIISIFGFVIGAFWVSIISQIGILSIIDTIGAFLGPLFGIIIVDYYFVNKQNINQRDLFSVDPSGKYFYSNGWNIKSFYSLLVAFVFSASTIWNTELRFLNSYSWIIGAFIGALMQFLFSKK